MEKLLFILYILIFCTPSVLTAQNCQDYTCNIAKARTALNNKKFKEAIDYCKAAKAYSNANIAEADALIYKVFEGIEEQKKIAEEATKQAKTEAENAKRAKENALQQAEIAKQEKQKAESATQRAEKSARAAENTAAFMKIRSKDSTLAMQMMYYNYMHHPEDKFTRDIYHQTINNQQSSFLLKIFRGHQREITTVVFSPDGKKVLSGSGDATVKLWNLDSGKAEKTFVGHTLNILAVTLSPDGKEMLTGSMDKTARLWKMGSERAEKTFIGHKECVISVAFSPDGKKVLTGSDDNTAKLWDIESEKVEKTFIGHTKSVIAVSFSRDGKKILTASSDKLVKLWDIENEKAEKTFTCYTAVVYNVVVAFSSDGKKILTSNGDDTKLWDIQSGKAEKTFIGHQGYVTALAFSQDGKKVLTGSRDNTAKLWDIESEKAEKTFIGHIEGVTTVAFSPDGKKVLTGSIDNTLKLWDIGSEKAEKTNKPINCSTNIVFSSDRKKMLVGCFGMAKLWDIESEKAEKTFIANADFLALAFSPDEKKILTADSDMTVKLWDIESEKVEKTFTDFTSYVNAVVFSSDGKKMLTKIDNTVQLRDIGSGKVEKTFMGHKDNIDAVVFSPDGKKLLTASRDNTAKLWDIEREKVEKTFTGHTYNVGAIAFSPDGKKALITSFNTVKLWDIGSEKVEKTFIGHSGYITTVAFSSDGKKVLTGSMDNTAKLWDIESEKAEKTFIGHARGVITVAFSSDGKKVLTGSGDETIKLWDMEKGAIEGWIYVFSLYDMAKAGLKLEPEDMSRYIADSTAFADKVKQDSLNYEQAIVAWGNSADYEQFIQKLIAWNTILINAKIANTEGDNFSIFKKPASLKTDLVDSLKNLIRLEKDTLNIYQYYNVLIDTLKARSKQSPDDYTATLANAYNTRAWLGFFLKKFKESEKDIRAGIALDSRYNILYANLAPALLLQGKKFKEAQAEYLKWKDKPFKQSGFTTYKDAFLDDLNTFEKAGIIPKERMKDVAAIRKLLEKKNENSEPNNYSPDGNPDSKVLEIMKLPSGGTNGFGGRGIVSAPKLQETSQKAGKVVLEVCIDAKGIVISAKQKSAGSTTTDADLVTAAIRNAQHYKFSEGSEEKQCGTITYNFVVK
jgi:WD40 repeat protein